VQIHTLFPTGSSANGVCANFADGDTTAYLVHVGEGTNASALNEFANLFTVSAEDGCLYDERTTVVHGTAFGEDEFTTMATNGMSLVWSPKSNVALYGGGTDLSKTTDVPLAMSKGITVALAPDWSMGGGPQLLDELRFADLVDNDQWGNSLDAEMLTEMVTVNAAAVLDVADQLGSLKVGFTADVTVFGGDGTKPFASLLSAQARDIRLVFVDGVPLYGDDQLEPMAPQSPGCEMIDVCDREKFLCVARDDGTASNKFGQTYAEIVAALNTELGAYDAMDLTEWDFEPIAPLAVCD
jgi:cytosine/adenosine deaminase-related metal-dependent hydrolase